MGEDPERGEKKAITGNEPLDTRRAFDKDVPLCNAKSAGAANKIPFGTP